MTAQALALILALLLFVITFLLYWLEIPRRVRSYRRLKKALEKIPGQVLTNSWLLGDMASDAPTEKFWMTKLKFVTDNNLCLTKYWLGPFAGVVDLNHPDAIKLVLKASKARYVYSALEPWLGKGLLIAEGDRWLRNRRLLTPAFHFDILRPYVRVYNECCDIFMERLAEVGKEGVNIHQYLSRLTLDILLRCIFSHNSHCQEGSGQSTYIKSILSVCALVVQRVLTLNMVLSNWLYMNFTIPGRKFKRDVAVVHSQSEMVIRQRKLSLGIKEGKPLELQEITEMLSSDKGGRKYLDFLDVLLTAQDENGHGLSDLEIRNEVNTFMFEGHDTTSNGLTWVFYFLAKYPEHQKICRDEVTAALDGRKHISFDDLPKLHYTLWCIKETLRLRPPVPEVFREMTEDVEFKGFLIPKEAFMVSINIFSVHHQPAFWENPLEFDPLRFDPSNDSMRHPYAYIPFSAGARNCIGQNFALNEMRVVVASVLNSSQTEAVMALKLSIHQSTSRSSVCFLFR